MIKGPNVMAGYLHNPEATAETIRDGWLHTGDVGYVDADGYFFIVDRAKDMIIRGGENIYPREIEEVLYTHAGVLECAVIGVPDEVRGEEVLAVVAPSRDRSTAMSWPRTAPSGWRVQGAGGSRSAGATEDADRQDQQAAAARRVRLLAGLPRCEPGLEPRPPPRKHRRPVVTVATPEARAAPDHPRRPAVRS